MDKGIFQKFIAVAKYKVLVETVADEYIDWLESELKSQPLPWTKEKPTKPCVVVMRTKRTDGFEYHFRHVLDMYEVSILSADEYLILEEL